MGLARPDLRVAPIGKGAPADGGFLSPPLHSTYFQEFKGTLLFILPM
jgi:hypothetical protein